MAEPREYPTSPIVAVGAVVFDGASILLVRRGREPLLGQWSLPGGVVELGETLDRALAREVQEETGFEVTPTAILKTLDRMERDAAGQVRFHYVLVDFLCLLNQQAAKSEPRAASDALEAQWVPVEELRESKQFVLPDDALEVIESGWRMARLIARQEKRRSGS